MQIYFSGTDIEELHDNAPNHNYYISLIVGYAGIEKWKAKIAICGEETVEGEVEIKNSYIGALKQLLNSSTKKVSTTKAVLYTIDLDIKAEEGVKTENSEMYNRINFLEEAKKEKQRLATKNTTYGNSYRHLNAWDDYPRRGWDEDSYKLPNNTNSTVGKSKQYNKKVKIEDFAFRSIQVEGIIKSILITMYGKEIPELVHLKTLSENLRVINSQSYMVLKETIDDLDTNFENYFIIAVHEFLEENIYKKDYESNANQDFIEQLRVTSLFMAFDVLHNIRKQALFNSNNFNLIDLLDSMIEPIIMELEVSTVKLSTTFFSKRCSYSNSILSIESDIRNYNTIVRKINQEKQTLFD